MNNRRMWLWAGGVLAVLFALVAVNVLIGHLAKSDTITKEQRQALERIGFEREIAKLSSSIEEERRAGEKALSKAGVLARGAVDEAAAKPDERAKEALSRLQKKLRFAALSDFDYLDAFPENTMVALRVRDMRGALEKARATQLGAAFMRPELAALRRDLVAAVEKDLSRERLLSFDDVHGQFALGNFNSSAADLAAGVKSTRPGKGYWGLLFELRGEDPQAKYAELTERALGKGGSIYEFEDIECVAGEVNGERGAFTRTGKNVFFGNQKDSLHTLLGALLHGLSFNTQRGVATLREALGKNCDASLLVNFPQDLKELLEARPEIGEQMRHMMKALGQDEAGMLGFSETIKPGFFEERAALLQGGSPLGVVGALLTPEGAAAPLTLFDMVPSNALAAAAGYIDGPKLEAVRSEVLASMQDSGGNNGKVQTPVDDLRTLETMLGLKPHELAAFIKGEACAWVTLGGFPFSPPDVSLALTAESEAKAKEGAALLAKAFAKIPAPSFVKNVYKNHTLYTLDLAQLVPGVPAKVSLNWAADGKHVFVTSSSRALQVLLNNLEKRAPGLLTQPAMTAALGSFSAEERRGAVLYADMTTLLAFGGSLLLPRLQDNSALSAEAKKGLTQLPPLGDLVKGLHPLVVFAGAKKDRVEAVSHGPLPLAALLLLLGGTESRSTVPLQ